VAVVNSNPAAVVRAGPATLVAPSASCKVCGQRGELRIWAAGRCYISGRGLWTRWSRLSGIHPLPPPRGCAASGDAVMIRSKTFQCASWVLTSFFIVLFVKPNATDRQLSRIFFINVYDGHLGAAGFAANNITDLHVVFIRHRFLQSSPMREAFRL
jgi:hypothetical protein